MALVSDKEITIVAMDAILEITGASWVSIGPDGIRFGFKEGTERRVPWPEEVHDGK